MELPAQIAFTQLLPMSRTPAPPLPLVSPALPALPVSPVALTPAPRYAQGLTQAQAAQRLAQEGTNTVPPKPGRRLWRGVLRVLREPMFMLLLGAAALYGVLGDVQEGAALLGLVGVLVGLDAYQESKSQRALDALAALSQAQAQVLRDGVAQRVASAAVVRGDVLLLSEGERVAADGWLLQSADLELDESVWTGESVAVAKAAPPHSAALQAALEAAVEEVAPMPAPQAPPAVPGGDLAALGAVLVLGGSLVVRGQGRVLVRATGVHGALGALGQAIGGLEAARSPLQLQTARWVWVFTVVSAVLGLALVLALGVLRGDWLAAWLAGIALAMALLPQEFAVVLAVLPALGAWRLAQQQVLTRRLDAIETLGATTVLCVDKTGTLTENRMALEQLALPPQSLAANTDADTNTDAAWVLTPVATLPAQALPPAAAALLQCARWANAATPFDPMELAIERLAQRLLPAPDTGQLHAQLLRSYGVSADLRAMVQGWRLPAGGGVVLAAKGAPEDILRLCRAQPAVQARVTAAVEALAAQGLRMLAVAQWRVPSGGHDAHQSQAPAALAQAWPSAAQWWAAQPADTAFECLGLLALADPLRPEVPQAVAQCQAAGVRVVMITGDYPSTALAIARQAGLVAGDAQAALLSGSAMDALDNAALAQRLRTVRVCARIAPLQKLRIVQALQAQGEVVAMTGDGVNDAPALKAAHAGIAMGTRATEVARSAAALVLLDDHFASIVAAIALGRRIYDNVRKAMGYIVTGHLPIAGIALWPLAAGGPLVLLPLHIVFLELLINPACSMVFENEAAQDDVMQRPPRNTQAPLFTPIELVWPLLQGLWVLGMLVLAYGWSVAHWPLPQARAAVFVVLVVGNVLLIFSNRSNPLGALRSAVRESWWARLRKPNRRLWWVVLGACTALLLTLYLPPLAALFFFSPLPLPVLGAALAWSALCGLGLAVLHAVLQRLGGPRQGRSV